MRKLRRIVLCLMLGLIVQAAWAFSECMDGDFTYKMNEDNRRFLESKYVGSEKRIYPLAEEAGATWTGSEFTVGNITYSVNAVGGGVTASRYKGAEDAVTIPSEVSFDGKSYLVTSLGNSCFKDCVSMASVEIPTSVTSLGDYCFAGCCGLASVEIPPSVTHMGIHCFENCTGMTLVDLKGAVTSFEARTFSGCTSLTFIPIPPSVRTLGESCFYGCRKLTTIDLPSTITEVGIDCFASCSSLSQITIRVPKVLKNLPSYCAFIVGSLFCDDYRKAYPYATVIGQFMNYADRKCLPPNVSYSNGRLVFSYDVGDPNYNYHYTITSGDGQYELSSETGIVNLSAKCKVTVYASSLGYIPSDPVTATLTWLDGKVAGTGSQVNVPGKRGILTYVHHGVATVSGLEEGEQVTFCDEDGKVIGVQRASDGSVSQSIPTSKGRVIEVVIDGQGVKVTAE